MEEMTDPTIEIGPPVEVTTGGDAGRTLMTDDDYRPAERIEKVG